MNVPFHEQVTDYTCGPATLQMVFEYLGKPETQKHLARLLKTDPATGTSHLEMIREAEKGGFYCYVNKGSSLQEIQYFLSRKLPVIVHFIEPSGEEGHYSVITGMKNRELILDDPWNGKNIKMSMKDFGERWHDERNHSKQWMMVLSNEDFGLGKQYLPEDSQHTKNGHHSKGPFSRLLTFLKK